MLALSTLRHAFYRTRLGQARLFRSRVKALRAWGGEDEARARLYSRFVEPGDLAFDVGANIGNRTKVFRRLGCRVVALEPQPSCASVLESAYRGDAAVTVLRAAAGSGGGAEKLWVSEASVLSSMSPAWIEAVKSSGRFRSIHWGAPIDVPVVTLDSLIEKYGQPAFVKIDVEGYEARVLGGLSRAVRALSYEFAAEALAESLQCVERLDAVGMAEFNFSVGESMELSFEHWVDKGAIERLLRSHAGDFSFFGDVYARKAGL